MSDKFLNFSGLTHYDAKIKTWARGRVDTVATSVSANTSNIQSLQTSVSGISQTTNELRNEVANLAQTVASGITTGSYQVDTIPQSGHTDHLVTSDGLYKAFKAKTGYYTCDTAGDTSAKAITADGYIYSSGGCVKILMTNKNTAGAATLNINGTGAYPLYYNGQQVDSGNTWEAGETIQVYFDGSNYQSTIALNAIKAYNVSGIGISYVLGITDSNNQTVFKIDDSGRTEVSKLNIIGYGTDARLDSDQYYQFVVRDAKDNVTFGIDHKGVMSCASGMSNEVAEKFENLEGIQIMQNDDWILAFVDSNGNLLMGFRRKEGTCVISRARIDYLSYGEIEN